MGREDRAFSEANALIHHCNIEPSVERSHCMQQANAQEEQMEERGPRQAQQFSALCLSESVFLNLIKSLPPVVFFDV